MILIGAKVKHIVKFGEGEIIQVDGNHFIVKFENGVGEKQFVYPDVFEKHMRFIDQKMQTEAEAAIKRNNEEKELESIRRKEEKRKEDVAKQLEKKNRVKRYKGHSIWLKFEGKQEAKQKHEMVVVERAGKKLYILNFPRSVAIKPDDEVYMVAGIENDQGKPDQMIIGRGIIRVSPKDTVDTEWITKYPWMKKYKYYSVLEDFEVLKDAREKGISLYDVLGKLGTDTYVASQGEVREQNELRRAHSQKSHMRITTEARDYIETLFEKKIKEMGSERFHSDD